MIELLRDIARRCEPGVSTVGKPETLRAVTQAADRIEKLEAVINSHGIPVKTYSNGLAHYCLGEENTDASR